MDGLGCDVEYILNIYGLRVSGHWCSSYEGLVGESRLRNELRLRRDITRLDRQIRIESSSNK
jgi:hypothetical protein